MLTCRDIVALCTEFVEGTLSPERRRAVEDHLARCPWCAEYVRQLQVVRDVTRRNPAVRGAHAPELAQSMGRSAPNRVPGPTPLVGANRQKSPPRPPNAGAAPSNRPPPPAPDVGPAPRPEAEAPPNWDQLIALYRSMQSEWAAAGENLEGSPGK